MDDKIKKILQSMNKDLKDDDSLVRVGDDKFKVETFSSGSIAIDDAIGVGGLPVGRIIEMFGPESCGKTTISLSAIASAQVANRICAFIDAEHALDPKLAVGCGVDWNSLLFYQPNYGEKALMMVEKFLENGVDVVVVDSVAALIPKQEFEGEIDGKDAIGAQSRMMSKALRKLVGVINRTEGTVIFINQIREKIGTMFGCLHADNLINFVNGESKTIKEIVDNKIEGEVWSYDDEKGFIKSKIIDWHYNGDVIDRHDYLSINIKGPGNKNGRMNITVTPDHEVLTENGFIKAENLSIGDKLVTKQPTLMSGTYGKFLCGIICGDSHITNSSGYLNSHLVIRDNIDKEYALWKVKMLSQHANMEFKEYNYNGMIVYTSNSHSELTQLKEKYPNRDPDLLFDNFSWLGFAVWIMDDACYNKGRYVLSIKRFKGDFNKIDEISKKLDDIGLWHHKSYGGSIIFDKDVSDKISNHISNYIPICMRHKLPGKYALNNQYSINLDYEDGYSVYYPEIMSIREASGKQMKNKSKYDISIDNDCHNYMTGGQHNGVIVHNSPETTPGGRALKFASTLRIEVKRTESILKNGKSIGNKLRVTIVKNKLAIPYHKAEVDLIFGKGVDNTKDIFLKAVEYGIVEKKGSTWHSYNDIKINGFSAFIEKMEEVNLIKEIDAKTRKAMIEFVKPLVSIAADEDSEDSEDDSVDNSGFDKDQK